MSGFWEPVGERTYSKIMRLGMSSQIAGVFVLSILLFNKTPAVLTLSLSGGAMLILLGLLAWLWGLIWGRG